MAALMPKRLNLGEHMQSTMLTPIHHWQTAKPETQGRRTVMGYPLPEWQRPLVWTKEQMVRLLESSWLGLNIGTYTFVQNHDPATDGLLIDGQQRLYAVQEYLSDGFPVFGHKWSHLPRCEQREFEMSRHFSCYIVRSSDETYLRSYYDLMNFGGTAHTEDQRASKDT